MRFGGIHGSPDPRFQAKSVVQKEVERPIRDSNIARASRHVRADRPAPAVVGGRRATPPAVGVARPPSRAAGDRRCCSPCGTEQEERRADGPQRDPNDLSKWESQSCR